MTHILVLYATSEGQTEKIAAEMVNAIRDKGYGATRKDLASWPGYLSLDTFDAVLIGASIHFKQFPAALTDWLAENGDALATKQTAFYSVSMTAAEGTEDAIEEVDTKMKALFAKTGWQPNRTAIFAGAMRYSEMGDARQRFGQYVSWRTVGDTDKAADHEYTDWSAVHDFVADFTHYLHEKEVSNV